MLFILKGIYIRGDLKRVLKTMRQSIRSVLCLEKFPQSEGTYKKFFDVFLTVHHSIEFFSSYQLNAHFLYSITIYMLHFNLQHVSSSTLLIFRRTNCINTASGIVTLCKQLYSMPVESGLQSALNRHTVRPFTESDDTRCCNNTVCPPEDEHSTARNMSRIIM